MSPINVDKVLTSLSLVFKVDSKSISQVQRKDNCIILSRFLILNINIGGKACPVPVSEVVELASSKVIEGQALFI